MGRSQPWRPMPGTVHPIVIYPRANPARTVGNVETNSTTDATANRTRWGGIILGLGVVLTLVGVILAQTNIPQGNPDDSAATRADRVVTHENAYQIIGQIYVYADILMAIGALFLVTRVLHTQSTFPGSAFWIFFGLGSLVYLVTDAFYGTGLITSAKAYATAPTVFESITGANSVINTIAGFTTTVGLLGVLYAETRAENAMLPIWLSWLGVVTSALLLLSGIAGNYGGNTMADLSNVLFYIGFYPAFVILAVWCARIAWPNLNLGMMTKSRTTERA